MQRNGIPERNEKMALKEIEIERLSEEEKNTRLNGILNSHPLGMALILVMSKGEVDYLSPPESQIRSHKLTVDVADRVLRKYKGELEFEKCEDLRSLDRMLFNKTLELVRPFVPEGQFDIIKYNCSNGEEREFFREKVRETALKIISVPEAEDGGNEHAALHYFHGSGTDIWIKDIDARNDEYFGFTCLNGDWEMAEYGYGSLSELMRIPGMELDLHFDGRKKTLEEIIDENKEAYHGISDGTEGFQADLRDEGEDPQEDSGVEAADAGGEVPENEGGIQEDTIPGIRSGLEPRADTDEIPGGSGGAAGAAGLSGDSGEGHHGQGDAGGYDLPVGAELLSPENDDGAGSGGDGDVDADGGRAEGERPSVPQAVSGGGSDGGLLREYSPSRIREAIGGGFGAQSDALKPSQIKAIREKCRNILAEKEDSEITQDDMAALSAYEGAGGLGEEMENGTHEILSEFYTPEAMIGFAWALVDRYQKDGCIRQVRNALEPSCGTGRFAKGRDEHFIMYEIDPVSSRIARILHPESEVINEPFQMHYVRNEYDLKPEFQGKDVKPYHNGIDLVIGNPPYGRYQGKYKAIGEGKDYGTYPEYFMARGIDELRNGGALCFVVPSGFLHSKQDSSKGKRHIAEFAELITAFRFPNSVFPTTDIATDIVLFRANKAKDEAEIQRRLETISGDRFFDRNPHHRFGSQSLSNFHKMLRVEIPHYQDSLAARAADALIDLFGENERFALFPNGRTELNYTDEERESVRDSNTRSIVMEYEKLRKKKEQQRTKAMRSQELPPVGKLELMDAKAFNSLYGRSYSDEEREIWKNAEYDGTVDLGNLSGKTKELLLASGDYVVVRNGEDGRPRAMMPKTLFASGNIYEKLKDLEAKLESNEIGRDSYEYEKGILESARPETIPFERIQIKPNSTFAEEFKVRRTINHRSYERNAFGISDSYRKEEAEISLKQDFLYWAGGADRELIFSDINTRYFDETISRVSQNDLGDSLSFQDIQDYLNGVSIRTESVSNYYKLQHSPDEVKEMEKANREKAEMKRSERMKAVNRLFSKYLQDREWLSEDERSGIAQEYNRLHNAVVSPDFSQIPIFLDGMNRFKNGREFILHDAQLRGINFLTQKGKGLLAYEVGVGKTSAGICATVLQIQSGRAKRPLVIVPKAVYPKWVKDIHEHFPEIRINALENLNKDAIAPFVNADDFRKLDIEEGSITVITYEGLNDNITFNLDKLEELKNEFEYIYGKDGAGRRAGANIIEKIDATAVLLGNKSDHAVYFDLCGWDHVTVDEAHNFKNLVTAPSGGEYKNIPSGTPSCRAKSLFAITQWVQKNNNDRNVFFLTATPFTNSPLEVYSMLTYLYRKELLDAHLYNIRDFIEEFIRVDGEPVITSKGSIEYKSVVKSWTNLKFLQNILQNCMDRMTADEAAIERPERMVEKIMVEPTELQKEIFERESRRIVQSNGFSGDVLKAITNKKLATLSPSLLNLNRTYDGIGQEELPSASELVSSSPKLKITCEIVAKSWKAHPDQGQVIYMTYGKELFPTLKGILSKGYGIPENAIETIDSGTSSKKSASIQEKFNDPKSPVKILIGSDKIKEGVDLNGNSTILYNLNLGWNPTDLIQSEGRIWRQGNRQGIVHIVYVLENDTSDPFILQKLDEKKARIDEIWNYESKDIEIDVSDINPLETKYDLIRNPEERVRLRISDMTAGIRAERNAARNDLNKFASIVDELKFLEGRIGSSARPSAYDISKRSKIYAKLEFEYGLPAGKCDDGNFELKKQELKARIDEADERISSAAANFDEMVAREREVLAEKERERFESKEYYNSSDAVFEQISSHLKPAKRMAGLEGKGKDAAFEGRKGSDGPTAGGRKRADNRFDSIDDLANSVSLYLEKGIAPRDNAFILKETPSILQRIGYKNLEFSISSYVIDKARSKHELNNEQILNTIRKFSDPLFVLKSDPETSESKGKSSIDITDYLTENDELLSLTFYPDEVDRFSANKTKRNIATSIHQRAIKNPNGTNRLEYQIKKGLCLYINDLKLDEIKNANHIGSYTSLSSFASYSIGFANNNILLKSQIVNATNQATECNGSAADTGSDPGVAEEAVTESELAQKAMHASPDESRPASSSDHNGNQERTDSRIKGRSGRRPSAGEIPSLFDFIPESPEDASRRIAEIEEKRKEQAQGNAAVIRALKTQKDDEALAENWRRAFEETKGDTISNIMKGYKETKPESLYGKRVESSSDMAALLRALRNPNLITHKVISLDKDDRILDARVIAIGESDKGCLANPSFALMNLSSKARKIYVSHNRPDGDVEMRDSDLLFSKQVEEIAREKGIEFKDNIITNGTRFYLYSARETRKYHKCDKEIWENMDASLLGYKIDGARDIEVLSSALRQSSPGMKHLIYLTGDDRVCGAHKYHSLEDLKAGLLKTKEIGASKVCCDSPDWKHAMEFASAFGVRTGIVMDGYGNVVDAGSAGTACEPAVRKDTAIGTACDVDPDSGTFAVRFFSGGLAAPAKIPCRCQGFARRIKDGSSVLVRGTWESDGTGGGRSGLHRIRPVRRKGVRRNGALRRQGREGQGDGIGGGGHRRLVDSAPQRLREDKRQDLRKRKALRRNQKGARLREVGVPRRHEEADRARGRQDARLRAAGKHIVREVRVLPEGQGVGTACGKEGG